MPRLPSRRRSYPPSVFSTPGIDLSQYLVFDDFNRPDGPIGTASTGQVWVASSATISNHQMVTTSDRTLIDTGHTQISIYLTFGGPIMGGSLLFWADPDDPWKGGTIEWGDGDTVGIYLNTRNEQGTPQNISAGGLHHVLQVGDVVGVRVNDTEIVLSVNDTASATYPLANLAAFNRTLYERGTYAGVSSWGPSEVVDNFTVSAL